MTDDLIERLRPAMDVYIDSRNAFGRNKAYSTAYKAAAAVIEADRQAVREQTVAKIVAWVRSGNAMNVDMASAWVIPAIANAIEAGEWK